MAILCSGLGTIAPTARAAPLNSAKVTQIIKEVTLLPGGGASRPASVSDEVNENSAVRTGNDSRAELTFNDLTITRLGANTVFSFNKGKREIDLSSGAVLVQVPRNGDAATVRTAAATAAISGGTAMVEYHVGFPLKLYVLEGKAEVCTPSGECTTVPAGQTLTSSNGKLSKPVGFNIQKMYQTSLLLTDFSPLPNDDLIQQQIEQQQTNGDTSNQPPPTSNNNNNPTDITDVTNVRTDASPPPTNGVTPPSKFGPPSTITSPDPYVIGSGTQVNTDPTITTNGVTNYGTIYRTLAEDGPPTQFLFGESPTSFDSLVFDSNNPVEHPIAVFKFAGLQLTGNPTVTIGSGSPDRLALVSTSDITSGGPGGTLTFTPATRLSLVTQNGSINLGSEISFAGLDHIEMYARGAGSTLTLASPISGVNVVDLNSGGDINVSGSISATSEFRALAQGSFSSGNTQISANNIGIQSLDGDVAVNGTSLTASSLSLTAGGTVNFTSSIGLGKFPTYDMLSITGQTVNIGSTSMLYGTATISAGTGGINASGVDFEGDDLTLTSGGDIHVFNVITPIVGNQRSLAGSITAAGAFTSGPEVFTGTLQAGTSITASGLIQASSITAGTDITTGGTLEIGFDPNGNFGNITAGGNIVAGNGIFTPGTPCVVSAGGSITVSDGGVITGTLQAGGAISVSNSSAGGGFVGVNSITAGDTLTFNNISSLSPDNSVASGGVSFTPVDMTISAAAISSSGPNYPALSANGADASEANVANAGNGGNVSIEVTQSGLAVGNTQDIGAISADGGTFDNGTPTDGGNGGTVHIAAASNVAIDLPPAGAENGATISATTGIVPNVFAQYVGAGGTVTINSPGTIGVSGTILVSSDDARNFAVAPALGGTPGRESASGGDINLKSTATVGIGINVSGSLLSLLNNNAPGPGGTITLSTMGSNILVSGTIEADRGTIVMDQNDPVGSISIDGATLIADTLNINGAGDVNIGTDVAIDLNVANVSVSAPGAVFVGASDFNGNQLSAISTGGSNVHVETVSGLTANGPVVLNSVVGVGGFSSASNVTLVTGEDFINNSTTDFSRLEIDNAGLIDLNGTITANISGNLTASGPGSATVFPAPGDFEMLLQNTNGQIGNDANITLRVGQNINVNGLLIYLQNYDETASPAGSIGNNANIDVEVGGDVTARSYIDLFLNNRGGGAIGNSANLTFTVSGALNTGANQAEFALSNRYDDSAGNTTPSSIGADAIVYVHAASVTMPGGLYAFGISNRGGSQIGNNATATFDVTNDASIGDNPNSPGFASFFILNDVSHDLDSLNPPAGGAIGNDATLTVTVGGNLTLANDSHFYIDNRRNNGTTVTSGGEIGNNATISVSAASLTCGGQLDFNILNHLQGTAAGSGGLIGNDATVTLTLTNALTSTFSAGGNALSADINFLINNKGTSATATGGLIGGSATINVNVGSISSTNGNLNARVTNAFGEIGNSANVLVSATNDVAAVNFSGTIDDTSGSINQGGNLGGGAFVSLGAANLTLTGNTMNIFNNNGVIGSGGIGDALIDLNLTGTMVTAGGSNTQVANVNGSVAADVDIDFTLTGDFNSFGTTTFDIYNSPGTIGGNATIDLTAANVSVNAVSMVIQNNGGTIGSWATMNVNTGNLTTTDFAQFIIDNSSNGSAAKITLDLESSASVNTGNFFETFVNNNGGQVQGSASVLVNVAQDLINVPTNPNAGSGQFFDLYNVGGTIGQEALVQVNAASLSDNVYTQAYINNQNGSIGGNASVSLTAQNISANYLFAGIDNNGTGSIGGNATVDVNVSGNVDVTKDTYFRITGNDPTGSAAINVTGGNYNVSGTFLSFIDGNGTTTLTNATIAADVLKIGVFGPNGTLKIGGGGMLSAASELKLYANGSNGTIEFTASVTLDGGSSAAILAANTVTIDNGKTVTLGTSGALVYANNQNYNTAGFGQFSGTVTSNPLSSAPTFGNAPVAPAVGSVPPSATSQAAATTAAPTVNLSNSSELRSVVDQAPATGGRVTVQATAFKNRTNAPGTSGGSASTSTRATTTRFRSVSGVSTVAAPMNASSSPAPARTSSVATDRWSRY